RTCERSGLKRSEGEEISLEVFSKLARRMDRRPLHHPSESLRAWLTRTTHQLILDRHRSRRRHPLGPAAIALLQEWLPPASLADEENRRRERMEGHLWAVCLARVRSASPARHWQIFEAYALEGMSSAEVARSFGTTGFNVRQIRRRLVARLRREWSSLVTQAIEPEPEA
ncbi:MAG: RNA polymerase sigma factor, partial [Verrucomicrobiota bacterium]